MLSKIMTLISRGLTPNKKMRRNERIEPTFRCCNRGISLNPIEVARIVAENERLRHQLNIPESSKQTSRGIVNRQTSNQSVESIP